jgi:hypothetical protein
MLNDLSPPVALSQHMPAKQKKRGKNEIFLRKYRQGITDKESESRGGGSASYPRTNEYK